jgi:hypothetical protein
MPKSREKTRANKSKNEMLNGKNEYGHSDSTPYQAVRALDALGLPKDKIVTVLRSPHCPNTAAVPPNKSS